MDGALHAPQLPPFDRVAGLVRPAADPEALSAVGEHLRHEGESVEPATLVQRAENLFFAPNLDDVAGAQRRGSLRVPKGGHRTYCTASPPAPCGGSSAHFARPAVAMVVVLNPQRLDHLSEQDVGQRNESEAHGEVAPPSARDHRDQTGDERDNGEAVKESIELDLADDPRLVDVIQDGLDGVADRGKDRPAGSNPAPPGCGSPSGEGPGRNSACRQRGDCEAREDSVELDLADPGRRRDVGDRFLNRVTDGRRDRRAHSDPAPSRCISAAKEHVVRHVTLLSGKPSSHSTSPERKTATNVKSMILKSNHSDQFSM